MKHALLSLPIIAMSSVTMAEAPSSANSSSDGFYYSGKIAFDFLTADSESLTVGILDANLGYEFDGGNSFQVGFDLDVDAFHLSDSGYSLNENALYPSLTLNSQWGKTYIGLPQDARTSVYNFSDNNSSAYLDMFGSLLLFPRSFLETAQFIGGLDTYGIRHDFGNDRYDASVSIHNYSFGSDNAMGFSAAIDYSINENFAVVASAEAFNESGLENNFELGTIATFGNFEGGILYSNGFYAGSIDMFRAYGKYKFNDRISATLNHLSVSDADLSSTSLGAEYTFQNGMSLGASAIVIDAGGTMDAYALTAGYRF